MRQQDCAGLGSNVLGFTESQRRRRVKYENRSKHAKKRVRDSKGRFLSRKARAEREKLKKEKEGTQKGKTEDAKLDSSKRIKKKTRGAVGLALDSGKVKTVSKEASNKDPIVSENKTNQLA